MQALLIGIDPPEDVKEKILEYKNRVRENCDYQEQVEEAPHITFVVNNFSDIGHIDEFLRRISSEYQSFELKIDRMSTFPPINDKRVLYAHVISTPQLQEFQKKVIIETSRFRSGSLLQEYMEKHNPGFKFKGKEVENIKKYGYPYVGSNFQPHITVAIIYDNCYDKVGKDILEDEMKFRFTLGSITVYTYDNGWKPWKNYKLGK